MKNVALYPYKAGSKSAKALAEALGIKRIRHEGKDFEKNAIINWGSSGFKRNIFSIEILNEPDSVRVASNKLHSFNAFLFNGVTIPEYTTNKDAAIDWIEDGLSVVCRTKLTGHSGEGIVIAEEVNQLVDAPLYTIYIKKKQEYRLHVFRDEVFFVQRKARNKDIPDDQVNWKVRNHSNGFIFAHKDVDVPEEVKIEARNAVACLGLDFGAVDIIQGTDGGWYVLEVNTACGLEGTTLEKYVEQFTKHLELYQ